MSIFWHQTFAEVWNESFLQPSFNKQPFWMWRKFWVLIYTAQFHSAMNFYLKRSRKIWYDPFRAKNAVKAFSCIPFAHRVLAFSDFLRYDLWAIVKMIICRHPKSSFSNHTDRRKSSSRERSSALSSGIKEYFEDSSDKLPALINGVLCSVILKWASKPFKIAKNIPCCNSASAFLLSYPHLPRSYTIWHTQTHVHVWSITVHRAAHTFQFGQIK